MKARKDTTIQFSEFAGKFTSHVNNADKVREESLNRLLKIRKSRQGSQMRQLVRLEASRGENDRLVVRQKARIASEGEITNYLSISIDKTATEKEVVSGSFLLQGRVFSKLVKGVAGLHVQLLNKRNRVVGSPAITDKKGDYSLVVELDDQAKSRKAIIAVFDREKVEIHRETLPVIVKSETVESRDILITDAKNSPADDDPTGGGSGGGGRGPIIRKKKVSKKVAGKAANRKKTVAVKKKNKSPARKKR